MNYKSAALTTKKADGTLIILNFLFGDFKECVRNFQKFLRDLSVQVGSWETEWGFGFYGVPTINLKEDIYFDPRGYQEEVYYQCAESGEMEVVSRIDLHLFPKKLFTKMHAHVEDRLAFMQATEAMLGDRVKRERFAKLLRYSTLEQIKAGEGACNYIHNFVYDRAVLMDDPGFAIEYSIVDTVAGASSYGFSGSEIEVKTNVFVTLDVERVEKGDFQEP